MFAPKFAAKVVLNRTKSAYVICEVAISALVSQIKDISRLFSYFVELALRFRIVAWINLFQVQLDSIQQFVFELPKLREFVSEGQPPKRLPFNDHRIEFRTHLLHLLPPSLVDCDALRANKSETSDCLKFTLEGSGERSDGNARTSAHALACRA